MSISKTKSVRSLDAMARKEIVDYVTGLGISILDKEESIDKTWKTCSKEKV